MTLNCLLTPAHLNSIWKVNSAKVHFYLLTCELKKIQLFVGRLGGKSKNICCIKRNIQFGKAKAFYLHIYMCMSTAIK